MEEDEEVELEEEGQEQGGETGAAGAPTGRAAHRTDARAPEIRLGDVLD